MMGVMHMQTGWWVYSHASARRKNDSSAMAAAARTVSLTLNRCTITQLDTNEDLADILSRRGTSRTPSCDDLQRRQDVLTSALRTASITNTWFPRRTAIPTCVIRLCELNSMIK